MVLRLLHAADALLDAPLQGIGTTPRDAVDLVAQATLIAWDRVVDAAITHNVDAVLLTGNTFDAAVGSLAADVALRQGCERLAEKEIPLFITPGPLDPVEAWDEIPALPDNVVLFRSVREDAVELTDHGRTLCLIQPIGPWSEPERKTPAASRPFSAGLWWDEGDPPPALHPLAALPDVICCRQDAVTAGWLKSESQVHRQTSPQGMTGTHTGPRGATLIEVDAQRRFTTRLLPLAPLRRDRLQARLDAVRHRDDLCDQMLAVIEELPVVPGEQLRLIDWAFTGTADAFHRLEFDDDAARDVVEMLNQITDQPGKLRYIHQPVPLWQGAVDPGQMSELWREYLDMLQQRPAPDESELRRLATELRPDAAASGAWERGLQTLDPAHIVDRAQKYGRRWFAVV
jgi:hypothetical protein